jgi:uncharacterized phage-associated protein
LDELESAIIGFSAEAAAQASAYFARREGGEISVLKLMKLMYIAERESVRLRGRLMFYDEHYSLPHGPVCSSVLNGVNQKSENEIWTQYVARKHNSVASLNDEVDHLSRSDLRILQQVWDTFGWMNAVQIRNWTHENCQEYTEINKGRIRISITEMGAAVGMESPALAAEDLQLVRHRAAAIS